MNYRDSAAFALTISLCCAGLQAGPSPALSAKHDAWLNRTAAVLLTPEEREVFLKLGTNEDRDLFIEEFWRQRDPTPGTPANECREEHDRRILYADERFGGNDGMPGSMTDRGRILISLGPPLDVQKYSTPDICPIEIWYYLRELRAGGPKLFRLLFFEKYGAEEFKLYNPVSDGPKRLVPFPDRWKGGAAGVQTEAAVGIPLPAEWIDADVKAYQVLAGSVTGELAEASISSFPGAGAPEDAPRSAALIAELQSSPQRRVKDDYAEEFLNRRTTGAVDYSVQRMGQASLASVLQDASGRFLVNYAIAPEILSFDFLKDRYFANLRTRIKATDAAGNAAYRAEVVSPIELARDELKALAQNPFELYGSFPLGPGTYTLDLVLENTVSKEFTSAALTITVPGNDALSMSPLVLSRNVVRDPSGSGADGRAFQVGAIQLYPSVTNAFLSKDRLFVFLQIYGLGRETAERGALEFSILSGDKVLRTSRRKLAEAENRRDFLEEFEIENWAPGAYAIKAALLDKDGREVLSRAAGFAISTQYVRGSWVYLPRPSGVMSIK